MHYLNYKYHDQLHQNVSSSGPVLCAQTSLCCMCCSQSLALLQTCLNNTNLYDIPSVASSRNVADSTLRSLSSHSDLRWTALCRRWHRKNSSSGTPNPRCASLSLQQRFPGDSVHIFAKKTYCLREYIIIGFIKKISICSNCENSGKGCWGSGLALSILSFAFLLIREMQIS